MTSVSNTRVLVTGASGFLGSHLVRRLLEEGAEVVIMTRYGNVVHSPRLAGVWGKLRVLEADLRNRGALEAISSIAPRWVFHLAAYNHVGESFRQVEECFDVNAKGTANVLDACMAAGVERFVYTSTSEVYGLQSEVPFVETMTPQPQSPYAVTKFAGEQYCLLRARTDTSTSIRVVRPFNAFGPGQSTKAVLSEIIETCLAGRPLRMTEGAQTREFNYVEDLVDGLLAAAHHPGFEGPINLAGGREISIRSLVETVATLTKTRSNIEFGALPYRPNEIWRMYADVRRAHEVLGWRARVGFEEGLRRTVAAFAQGAP
jgi:UDP-glucose 4-epimerase